MTSWAVVTPRERRARWQIQHRGMLCILCTTYEGCKWLFNMAKAQADAFDRKCTRIYYIIKTCFDYTDQPTPTLPPSVPHQDVSPADDTGAASSSSRAVTFGKRFSPSPSSAEAVPGLSTPGAPGKRLRLFPKDTARPPGKPAEVSR